jgi:hypothetical protein
MPVVNPMVRIEEVQVNVPPGVASDNKIVEPTHTDEGPVIGKTCPKDASDRKKIRNIR